MMKQNNPLRRLLAALLAALTLVSFTILPVLGAAEDEAADTEAAETTEATAPKAEETEMEIISISTEDDLIALAASCTLDAWSWEKHVVLEADLDLTGLTFSPIATFGGTFDGQGHTIRGLAITDALSPAGLICTLQPTGRVENLHIEGSVAPADIAMEVYHYIARAVAQIIIYAHEQTGASDVLLAGGVASSALLRDLLSQRLRKKKLRVRLHWARPEYAGDNACGVALIGLEQYMRCEER